MDKSNHKIKCVILGESNTGKSSIVRRFNNRYYDNISPTIGAEFSCHTIETDDKIITYELWDTAGQERFRALSPMYYRNASIAILAYDVTSIESFEQAVEMSNKVVTMNDGKTIIIFVGNKIDLLENMNDVKIFDDYFAEFNIPHIKTSAKKNINIDELLNTMTELIMKSLHCSDKPATDKIILEHVEHESSCVTNFFKYYFTR